MGNLFQFLKDADGQFSSKRLFALGAFVVAVVLAFQGRDLMLVGAFLTPAMAVLLGQAITGS